MGYFSLFKCKWAIFIYKFHQIIVCKLISKNFTFFPVEIVGIFAIFEREYQNLVKLAHGKHEILFYSAAFLSFWKSSRELVGEIKYAFAL